MFLNALISNNMDCQSLKNELGNIDVYLLDQVLKGRYSKEHKILDAGCGGARNMHWFLENGYDIRGIDIDAQRIDLLQQNLPQFNNHFQTCALEKMPFSDGHFDHIICNAVFHMATSYAQFLAMFKEVIRVLKPGGQLFIRMTSNIGIENDVIELESGAHRIPDGSTRVLITKDALAELMQQYDLSFIEPLKTVNVNDIRCMSTIVLRKN